MEMRKPITPEGYRMLESELRRLKKEERPKVINELARARAFGDVSENAEYDAAKERHAMLEARISELEYRLSISEIVDCRKIKSDKVTFGATVKLKNLDTDEVLKYKIVGEFESDASNGRISINSPIARSLIGKCAGDEVTVKIPAGIQNFEIIGIEYM